MNGLLPHVHRLRKDDTIERVDDGEHRRLGVVEQRHETEVHVQLLMAVEES